MQPRPSPTSPAAKAKQQAEAVSDVWQNGQIQQPPRTPWGWLIVLMVAFSLLVALGVLVGVGVLVHRYPKAWWVKYMPLSTTSTTVVQSKDSATAAVPTVVQAVQASAYTIARNQGKTGVYTDADTTGYAWPLSSSGWLISLRSAWPTDVKSLVVRPNVGQAQAVSSTVNDPASTFVFLKSTSLQGSPVSVVATSALQPGLRVWVVTDRVAVPHILTQPKTVRWVSSDRLETSWGFEAVIDVLPGSAVVDGDGHLVGLVGTDQRLWPADSLTRVINSVVQSSNADRPSAGFRALNQQLTSVAGDPTASGFLVGAPDGQDAVTADGPADDAGLKDGDVITTIDGQVPSTDLFTYIATRRIGESLKLEITRGTTTKTLTLKLGSLGS